MTDTSSTTAISTQGTWGEMSDRTKQRYAAERRFRLYGLAAIGAAVIVLATLVTSIGIVGLPAFFQTYIKIDVTVNAETVESGSFRQLTFKSMYAFHPEVTDRREKKKLRGIISSGAGREVRLAVQDDPSLIGTTFPIWVRSSDDVDIFVKGQIDRDLPQADRRVKDNEIAWIDELEEQGRVETRFNFSFFSSGDSREPEQAGIWGAAVGSFLTLCVTLAVSFPLGVLAAVYLEEYAPQNRWTDLIEVNINNLAAVPSIVFGLLGLAMFLNFFGMPRSAPLVGGMVLALMTLPTIIIATRAALKAVPPSIREAALGIGASELQVVTHHVVPLAMPGILTGTIIGMAQALGETAPLLMIGMVAFIVDIPQGIFDPSTVLPVQIYIWADSPERAFVAKTSAAILVLLTFLVFMNAIAVMLRKRFERRW
ncbi:MAG: phosphate ABC transporter permease PstA [Parvibaculaceae bacterium]|nr:phosphate ABC transporter permease PstA [Parvibaculaceae bacterium]